MGSEQREELLEGTKITGSLRWGKRLGERRGIVRELWIVMISASYYCIIETGPNGPSLVLLDKYINIRELCKILILSKVLKRKSNVFS